MGNPAAWRLAEKAARRRVAGNVAIGFWAGGGFRAVLLGLSDDFPSRSFRFDDLPPLSSDVASGGAAKNFQGVSNDVDEGFGLRES